MPNIKSAQKRMRQNVKRRARNRYQLRTLRSTLKDFRKKLEAGDVDGAREYLNDTYSRIDKSYKKGIIRSNTAARLKSRLAASLRRASA